MSLPGVSPEIATDAGRLYSDVVALRPSLPLKKVVVTTFFQSAQFD